MTNIGSPAFDDPLREPIARAHTVDETAHVERLLRAVAWNASLAKKIRERARELILRVRARPASSAGLEAWLREYHLKTQEGVALLCLAESLLRIPDATTADRLIREKLSHADWEQHLGQSESLFVNAATWGLLLTGRLVQLDETLEGNAAGFFENLVAHLGEPVVRMALKEAVGAMGGRFVMGETIEAAVSRARAAPAARYSFDMLGEAALTNADAASYLEAYRHAIDTVGKSFEPRATPAEAPSLSIKLSALHPRFELSQRPRVLAELVPRVRDLARQAAQAGIGVTIDAEESERLDLTLDVFEAVFASAPGNERVGLAVQAYQKRAFDVVAWLATLSQKHARRIPVRLVKGAYWDSEIKRAQQGGLADYPVFTRKVSTDLSYLACAKALLARRDCFYPQFATHNAHTLCAIVELAGADNRFEFQRLHGMGEALYETVTKGGVGASACRVYAPVGRHRELLPYLVRRLLENGANTSFVHQLRDPNEPIENLIDDPVQTAAALADKPHPLIAPPPKLFGKARENSLGINLSNTQELSTLSRALESAARKPWQAAPVVVEEVKPASLKKVLDPADTRRTVGEVFEATAADAERALNVAHGAQWQWNRQGAAARATILEAAANRFEAHRGDFIYLLVREAGKCLRDADAEVREAVDYCRYYAALARKTFANPLILDGPTGEENRLSLNGRGVFWCVSPWNFPLAIFTGQVAAALAAGNAVIAKPARATPLVAALAVRLLFEADVPRELLHFLPGPGALLGQVLLKDSRLAGVAFTGSTDTAHDLQRQLTVRGGALVPLIAETGGQNAMIVDSSALLEQAATDALTAAFNSVGQRCSALRVLFLQNDIADRALEIIKGAMDELVIGDPMSLTTDVGPVIDAQAQRALEQHDASLRVHAKLVHQIKLPPETEHGHFFGPRVFEIDSLSRLTGEVFGPCLHVVRYAADHLDKVCAAINATGYGLTLGVHTRVQTTARYIEERVRAGNLYVNRNQIGAVVGVQPFGGEGLSGTGFKAGGPHYLLRFATERVVSTNTAAVGGNTTLLSLDE